jgi:hypothetical protein
MASRAVYADNRYEPKRLVVDEGGDYHHVSIHGIVWTEWNQPVAVGQGMYTFQFCGATTGPCSDAPFYDEPAHVKLSGIRNCRGRARYTQLEVTSDSQMMNTLFRPFRSSLESCRARRHARR